MKRFNELTKNQQDQAVGYALSELKHCVEMGIVDFGKTMTDNVLKDYAIAAAMEAWYSEPHDRVIEDIVE